VQPGNPETYYHMACMYARWSNPDEAVTSLKLAVEKGFHDFDLIGRDPDLAGIRSTPFVRNLIASSGRALSNSQ
ncbi:MAG TPA: hypothetical protein VHN82_03610, partial [Methanoregula sp.]|nr:hypothetical protein [Methanoregula sp.]